MFKDFVANLFGKLYTKFYQNRPIFYRKYYKKTFGSLFSRTHCKWTGYNVATGLQ